MRRIRYQVACSLDGYIAGPGGESDWIVGDPDVDIGAIWAQFDTLLMGRRTWEAMAGGPGTGDLEVVVFSTTLSPAEVPGARVVSEGTREVLNELRSRPGKDIWLFGGGELFRSLLALGCVDTVEPAIIPVILGGGIPLLPSPAVRRSLSLTGHRVYPKSGIVHLEYAVTSPAG